MTLSYLLVKERRRAMRRRVVVLVSVIASIYLVRELATKVRREVIAQEASDYLDSIY